MGTPVSRHHGYGKTDLSVVRHSNGTVVPVALGRHCGGARMKSCRAVTIAVALVGLMPGCAEPIAKIAPEKIDPVKYETLHRAARATRTQTSVGITLLVLRDLVGKYATEVSLAGDHVHSPIEQQFVGLHTQALTAYRDSLDVWEKKLESGQDTAITLTLWGSVGIRKLADKYAVPGESIHDGDYQRFSLNAIMRAAWHRAEEKLDAADALYRGEAQKAP
jgi:hypothetical protein